MRRIVIRKVSTPKPGNMQEDIDFLCRSLGFFSERDKQDTAGKVFRIIVRESSDHPEGLTSDEIAKQVDVTRGAIIHHLNHFMERGIIIRERNKYKLRSESLQRSIEEMREDAERMFSYMMKIAEDVDRRLGNFYR